MKGKHFLILLTLFFAINSYSQTTLPKHDSKSFSWKGGDNKFYKVKFIYGLKEKIKKETMDKAVMNMMVGAKFKLKYKTSFIPKKLTIIKTEGKYSGVVECLGKNAFGVENENKFFYEFDLDGNVTYKFGI